MCGERRLANFQLNSKDFSLAIPDRSILPKNLSEQNTGQCIFSSTKKGREEIFKSYFLMRALEKSCLGPIDIFHL